MVVYLIGFMGTGKSVVGLKLSRKLNIPLLDMDDEIVRRDGRSIPEIFAQDGEDVFRRWETTALENLGKQSALVIATGGGCVTRSRNYPLLHQNGMIVWLQRDLSQLPTDGRPLSQANRLEEMYALRRPMYEAFGDIRVSNAGCPEDTVNEILSRLEELS